MLVKYFPISVICCDKEGCPVLYHDGAGDEVGKIMISTLVFIFYYKFKKKYSEAIKYLFREIQDFVMFLELSLRKE